jgi:trehalose-6-phosphatase
MAMARVCYVTQVYLTLTSKMEPIPGAKVEHNKFCLSVHFRCVQEEVCPDLAVCLLQLVCFCVL